MYATPPHDATVVIHKKVSELWHVYKSTRMRRRMRHKNNSVDDEWWRDNENSEIRNVIFLTW